MRAYDLEFPLLMRHEYHWEEGVESQVVSFSMSHKVRTSISTFDEQSSLQLKGCETYQERILF